MKPLLLTDEDLHAEVSPRWGGALASFFSLRNGERIDWLRPAPPGNEAVRSMASFPMVPFCNRLRGGRSDYGPRPVAMGPEYDGSVHRRHGLVWRMPWRVEAQTDNCVRMSVRHDAAEWPYAFFCTQDIVLDAQAGLTLTLSVTNLDTVPMPVGLGHHCFFPDAADARMALCTEGMWETDAELLPTRVVTIPKLHNLAAGTNVSGLDLDNTFTDWDGEALVTWPQRGVGLFMQASKPMDLVTVFTPSEQAFFCIEPVSNVADWMNLTSQGHRQTGGMLLDPGKICISVLQLTPCSLKSLMKFNQRIS